MGASWLTLKAPLDRAIPENFLRGLLEHGIQPILHFDIPLPFTQKTFDLSILFKSYARWGVKYVVLFDRPNLRSSWSGKTWAQDRLVERFLDIYLPLAELVAQQEMTPVFPPLEPGGDYWDTAFLHAALRGIQRRGYQTLLSEQVYGAYAWASNRSLDWGAGGPERWPQARPYVQVKGAEDQIGFRIFDWYLTIINAVLGSPRPILLLGAGSLPGDQKDPSLPAITPLSHAERNLAIARLMADEKLNLEPVPSEVLCCNFWLLAATPRNPKSQSAWFQPHNQRLPVVEAFHKWMSSSQLETGTVEGKLISPTHSSQPKTHPIKHFLLLPSEDESKNNHYLQAIRPFITKYQPTIGFSPEVAMLANRVTILGDSKAYPYSIIESMLAAGCMVERLNEDGTTIATKQSQL